VSSKHHRIILHIARIERQYVVVWPREQRSAKTAIMALAIDMALDGLKLQKDARELTKCPVHHLGLALSGRSVASLSHDLLLPVSNNRSRVQSWQPTDDAAE
jgi:hypothetical protein